MITTNNYTLNGTTFGGYTGSHLCSKCQHHNVCKYEKDYNDAVEKINGIKVLNPFSVKIDCEYFRDNNFTISYDTISGGTIKAIPCSDNNGTTGQPYKQYVTSVCNTQRELSNTYLTNKESEE